MPLNKHQRIAADVYGAGDYAYVTSLRQAEGLGVGDTLFKFVMRELSTEEDCDTTVEAIHRMQRAQANIQAVLDGLRGI